MGDEIESYLNIADGIVWLKNTELIELVDLIDLIQLIELL